MKKLPLYFNDNIVGYVDNTICNSDGVIEFIKIYLFYSENYNFIMDNIRKSMYSKLNNGLEYDFEIFEDHFICKLKN